MAFYTVPGDPARPFEHPELEMAAKTWNGEWYKWGGGGTVWDAMAYDPEGDLLYVGTGNGGPWNQNIRSPKGGDNLFLASIIAVKPDTGRMAWYFQEVPGETWDFTATQRFILADLNIDGKDRKVIMHTPKNGYFYVLDRLTGQFISGKPFVRRMTWSMGLDKNGRPIEAPGARYTTNSIKIWPGAGGAHNWQPMAFSPITGLVYIPGNEGSATYSPIPASEFKFTPGRTSTGVNFGGGAQIPDTEYAATQPDVTGRFLVAWDPVKQRERWRVLFAQGTGGGERWSRPAVWYSSATAPTMRKAARSYGRNRSSVTARSVGSLTCSMASNTYRSSLATAPTIVCSHSPWRAGERCLRCLLRRQPRREEAMERRRRRGKRSWLCDRLEEQYAVHILPDSCCCGIWPAAG